MGAILTATGLVKHFGDVRAVDGVHLHVRRGEIFGLLGPNGAGKTTTIRILCQVLRPDAGSVTVDGLDLRKDGTAIKRLIGLVPQEIAVYKTLTASDNLVFFGRIYGLGGAELRKRIDEALDIVGLKSHAGRTVKTFSSGMTRRLNIAAGLLHRPKLLFLDEPAVGVDPQSRNHILESIQRLNREFGITVLYTSHYMEEVEQICKRAAIIDHGRILVDDTLEHPISRHGGGALLIVLDADAEAAAAALAELEELEKATADGNRLTLLVENPQRFLPKILDRLTGLGAKVEDLEVRRSNLETVFLNLTGRSLRDE